MFLDCVGAVVMDRVLFADGIFVDARSMKISFFISCYVQHLIYRDIGLVET